ncbi:hypothetical protein VNO78_10415 [Psophocarpus tetragonolobus]|uniref:MBD domain-containing protein n=1 Tax=Psophocarpus tetragonolobus TaxID=3891 RepID=A0AAN9XMI3_PSOTE
METTVIEKSQETNKVVNNKNSNSKQQSIEKANERPDWLPDGWSMEVRTRKSGVHMGSGYKYPLFLEHQLAVSQVVTAATDVRLTFCPKLCYIEPLKGYKFFSKPEVLRYLETVKDNNGTSKKGKKCSNMHSSIDNSCTSKKGKKCSNMNSPNENGFTPKERKCTNMDSPNDNSSTPKKEKKGSNMVSLNNNSCTPKKEKKCSNMDSPNDNSCTLKKEKRCTSMDSPINNSCTPKKEKNCRNMDSPTDVCISGSLAS